MIFRRRAKPLTTTELIAIAKADRLSAAEWNRLVATFEADPEMVRALRDRRAEVPDDPVSDPFVSALRRLCWPSDRLPGRHRKAIAAVGSAPLGFLRLVVEEGRTYCWRNQSPAALSPVATWLVKRARADPREEVIQLAGRALGYRNLVACYTVAVDDPRSLAPTIREIHKFVRDFRERCEIPLEAEGLMAGWVENVYLQRENPEYAADLVRHFAEDSDTLILLGFMEGYLNGILKDDAAVAVAAFLKALEHRDSDSDPWLEFFVHYCAARVLVNVSLDEVGHLPLEYMKKAGSLLPQPEEEWGRELTPLGLLKTDYQMRFALEHVERRGPALRYLEAVEPLFHEFKTPQVATTYYRLLFECHRCHDPYQALDYACDAILAAEQVDPNNELIDQLMVSAALMMKLSRRLPGPRTEKEVFAIQRRVAEVIDPRWAKSLRAYKAQRAAETATSR